jgi:hypothetical protein
MLIIFAASSAFADAVLVEVFYLPHRPAEAVVQKIDQTLAGIDGLLMKKYSFEDPSAGKLIKKYKLFNHMPVAVFINGKDTHTVDGIEVVFRNFPKGDAFVPTFEGGWSYGDLRKTAEKISGGK